MLAKRFAEFCSSDSPDYERVSAVLARHGFPTGTVIDDDARIRGAIPPKPALNPLTAEPGEPGKVVPAEKRARKSRANRFTHRQGQYLAYIHAFTRLQGQAPSERDVQGFFRVSPPTVHQMLVKLEGLGLIERTPGKARSIRLLVDQVELPELEASGT